MDDRVSFKCDLYNHLQGFVQACKVHTSHHGFYVAYVLLSIVLFMNRNSNTIPVGCWVVTLYAHIEIVVAFLVVKLRSFFFHSFLGCLS